MVLVVVMVYTGNVEVVRAYDTNAIITRINARFVKEPNEITDNVD